MFFHFFLFSLFFFLSHCSSEEDIGLIAFFPTICPDGWEAYTEADGRFIISSGSYNSETYTLNSVGGTDQVALTEDVY